MCVIFTSDLKVKNLIKMIINLDRKFLFGLFMESNNLDKFNKIDISLYSHNNNNKKKYNNNDDNNMTCNSSLVDMHIIWV